MVEQRVCLFYSLSTRSGGGALGDISCQHDTYECRVEYISIIARLAECTAVYTQVGVLGRAAQRANFCRFRLSRFFVQLTTT